MDIRNKVALYFRNNWGLKVNIHYWMYWNYCRLLSKPFSFSLQQKKMAKEAWKEGVAKIGNIDVKALSEKVTQKFDDRELVNGYAALSRAEVMELVEPIYQAIKELEPSICAYYKAFFKVNWVDIQKIAPGVQPKGSSFSYHIDDSPFSLAKAFIYLTDTYSENGAFRAFNYEWTDKFLRKGLLKSTQPGEVRDGCQKIVSKEDETSLKVIEGERGTAFIFDNNLAHKGTLPQKGCRMHVSMEIMPSTRAISFQDIVEACSRIPADNYNPKPFPVKNLKEVVS